MNQAIGSRQHATLRLLAGGLLLVGEACVAMAAVAHHLSTQSKSATQYLQPKLTAARSDDAGQPMTHCDLEFPVRGQTIPRDHGYALYGALSRALPELHGADWIGIHGIGAKLLGPETLTLHPKASLRIRVPVERIGGLLPLAGRTVEIAGQPVVIGVPSVWPLQPAAVLDSRLVVIKLTGGVKQGPGFVPAEYETRFRAEASRQLGQLGVEGELHIRGRSSITVGGRRVIGCAVQVAGLSAEHSVLLQIHGIGGKRTMGCGVFRPARSTGV